MFDTVAYVYQNWSIVCATHLITIKYSLNPCIRPVVFLVNDTCTERDLYKYCSREDHLFLWTLVPIITRTTAYHLVFMTALEFISAQAPLKMKGSLICLWYALSAIRYLTQAASTNLISKEEVWLIYTGVKASLMLLSILLYCCVAKHYRYRLRDEVVNERYLVEEVYDRELRLAEQYERDKQEEMNALTACISQCWCTVTEITEECPVLACLCITLHLTSVLASSKWCLFLQCIVLHVVHNMHVIRVMLGLSNIATTYSVHSTIIVIPQCTMINNNDTMINKNNSVHTMTVYNMTMYNDR